MYGIGWRNLGRVYGAGQGGGGAAVGGVSSLLFDFNPSTGSGVANLPQTLTFNGTTVTNSARYAASQATTSLWTATAGGNLAISSTGVVPTVGLAAPFTASASRALSIAPAGAAYVGTAVDWDVTTEDVVYELIFRMPNGSSSMELFAKYRSSGNIGIVAEITAAAPTQIRVYVRDSVTSASAGIGATLVPGAWYHMMVLVDRSVGMRVYFNGILASSDTTVRSGSLTNTACACIGAIADAAGAITLPASTTQYSLFSMWKGVGLLNTTAEQDAVVLERFVRLTGIYPSTAKGAGVPTNMSRSTSATVDIDRDDDGIRRVFLVGANWMRLAKRKEALGSTRHIGALIETAATNRILQSQTMGTTWLATNISISADSMVAPDGSTTADGVVASTTNGAHAVTQAASVTAAIHTFSAWLKKGSNDFAALYVGSPFGNGVMFDLANGVVGGRNSATTNIVGYMEPWGDGWYRCWVVFTPTASSPGFGIYTSQANWASNSGAQHIYAGDNVSVGTYIWGAQVELGDVPSAYIATTTAMTTRNADTLSFEGAGNATNGPGTMEATFMTPDLDAAASCAVFTIGAATAVATDRRILQIAAAGDAGGFIVNSGATNVANITGVTDLADGNPHTLRGIYSLNDFRYFEDGVAAGTPDTAGAIPLTSPTIYIGSLYGGTNQLNGLVTRARIWSKALTP